MTMNWDLSLMRIIAPPNLRFCSVQVSQSRVFSSNFSHHSFFVLILAAGLKQAPLEAKQSTYFLPSNVGSEQRETKKDKPICKKKK
jgi:hypothetical protein